MNVRHLLTTPHGDREPSEDSSRSTFSRAHYPSWGSGTRRAQRGCQPATRSLPLMGIGNVSSRRSGGSPKKCSLPLMGIGNSYSPPIADTTTLGSLPLMGIGNKTGRLVSGRVVALTTPHGDREPPRRRPDRPIHPTHYPSWGSGTTERRALCPGLWLSLPLMGIGNLSYGAEGERVIDGLSLPLMGIGNLTLLCAAHLLTLLTTPHGDREPSLLSVVSLHDWPMKRAKMTTQTSKSALGLRVRGGFPLKRKVFH